jgi:lysozyme
MSDSPVCIDISHWQDFPDFNEVYAAGVKGMIHKATEGSTYIDPNRVENCANAMAAGLAISTYFWIKPGDGRAQAEFYLSVIDPVPGERVVIDYEESGCTLTTLKDAVQALLDYKQNLKITVYSGHLLKEQLGDKKDDYLAQHTDLWLAQYTSSEDDISWPSGTYPKWALWQYSETGEVDGIDGGYVDLNEYNGSESEFLKWISPTGVSPPPKPVPPDNQRTVNVAITAPDDVKVKVSVNERMILRWTLQKPRGLARRGPDLAR